MDSLRVGHEHINREMSDTRRRGGSARCHRLSFAATRVLLAWKLTQ